MIKVTRMGGHDEVVLNAELIETIEARPDTIITLTTGKKILITESVMEVVRRVIEYRQVIRPIIRTNAMDDSIDIGSMPRSVDLVEVDRA